MTPYIFSNDLQCWQQLRLSDPTALGYLYDTQIDSLFAAALRVTHDRELAKDAVQEVFIEIWTYRQSLGVVRNTQSYLTRVLQNILYKRLHSRNLSAEMNLENVSSPDQNVEEMMVSADSDNEQRTKLRVAVSTLTVRQKQILELRFNQGLTYDQIAVHLEMNYQSVNNLAFRTLRRLRMSMSSLVVVGLLFRFYRLM